MSTRTKKPDRGAVYVCWNPFGGTLDDGVPYAITKGARIAFGHPRWPLVELMGEECFVRDGLPLPDPQAVAFTPPTPAPAARILTNKYKAIRTVELVVDGIPRTITKDAVVEVTDPIVLLVPDAFQTTTVES